MPATMRTHLITDIRNYQRIVQERGETGALKVMRVYERTVRDSLPNASIEADHVADQFHLVFPTPSEAVETAVGIANALQRYNNRHPESTIPVGFGVDASQTQRKGKQYVGSAPVTASLLASRARPGQVLISEAVFALLRPAPKGTRDLGVWKPPKSGAIHLHQVRPADSGSELGDDADRFLAVLFFTDIVASTATAASLGEMRWRQVVEGHNSIVREELQRHGGAEIDTAGDGFYASFDAPSRAIACALTVRDRVRGLGIEIRAGIHAGECAVIAGKIGGMAVVAGARIKDLGGPGEVLVSQTVRDLLVGSGLVFTERGRTALKGVPGYWDVYAVGPSA